VPTQDLNRSLQRGIEILRAFGPGSDLHGNGELAERTGLSRATISRLAQTLVDCGMLERDRRRRAYRLAAPVLSLAHAMRTGSPVLAAAGPMMRKEAERHKINVGLAVADRHEMVYLESVRYSRRVSWRSVVAGQRVPMELTSLGRAYLAAIGEDRCNDPPRPSARRARHRRPARCRTASRSRSALPGRYSRAGCGAASRSSLRPDRAGRRRPSSASTCPRRCGRSARRGRREGSPPMRGRGSCGRRGAR